MDWGQLQQDFIDDYWKTVYDTKGAKILKK
jgi:hypothetical protein